MAALPEVHPGQGPPGLNSEATDPDLSTASPREDHTLGLRRDQGQGSDHPSDQILLGDHHLDR